MLGLGGSSVRLVSALRGRRAGPVGVPGLRATPFGAIRPWGRVTE